ncbi:MAG: VOC family protein [Proteobacteria bacterium]|nr:VOC family protein [Pseudomonadota bacterium]
MFGYVMVGTDNVQRAGLFYDELLAPIDAIRTLEYDNFISWSNCGGFPSLCVIRPFNGEPALAGNGVMVSLKVESNAKVDTMYQVAMRLGSVDEGGPGFRGDGGFYGAYFRDLDGHKLCVFCINEETKG